MRTIDVQIRLMGNDAAAVRVAMRHLQGSLAGGIAVTGAAPTQHHGGGLAVYGTIKIDGAQAHPRLPPRDAEPRPA